MIRTVITAALVVVLGLSAAGCGGTNAATSAHRWNDAQTQQRLARGDAGERNNAAYQAGDDGWVKGFRSDGSGQTTQDQSRAGRAMTNAGRGLKDAGEDLAQGAKDAARGVGDAVEDTLDDMGQAARDMTR